MRRGSWDRWTFPNLTAQNHKVTSRCTPRYNCIAWAADEMSAPWWPTNGGYWPEHTPRLLTPDAFILAFATKGYEECTDSEPEPRTEKVALYVNDRNIPQHMARQLRNGKWASKLGTLEDIVHDTLLGVAGPPPIAYGQPKYYLRRKRRCIYTIRRMLLWLRYEVWEQCLEKAGF
jgi:hypothetical protein